MMFSEVTQTRHNLKIILLGRKTC